MALGEQLELEFEFEEAANKPGSFLMAIREAYYAGYDVGHAHADGYVNDDDTKFELWYAKKFLGGLTK